MNNTITPPAIPEQQVVFAKAVADLAIAHGIDRFAMTYEPKRAPFSSDTRIRGDLRILFSDRDGRGRPCRNLSIDFDSHLTLAIESNSESSN